MITPTLIHETEWPSCFESFSTFCAQAWQDLSAKINELVHALFLLLTYFFTSPPPENCTAPTPKPPQIVQPLRAIGSQESLLSEYEVSTPLLNPYNDQRRASPSARIMNLSPNVLQEHVRCYLSELTNKPSTLHLNRIQELLTDLSLQADIEYQTPSDINTQEDAESVIKLLEEELEKIHRERSLSTHVPFDTAPSKDL